MIKIVPADIDLGEPLGFSIYDENGRLLLRQGVVVTMPDQVDRLIARGALRADPVTEQESAIDRSHVSDHPIVHEAIPAYEQLSGLILNLKHVIGTALKMPEQIDITARVNKIASGVQQVCAEDIDAALAAPCLDFQNPYIVVHQMMGAVLTEIIAQGKGIPLDDRRSLVCAALTRDLGQISIQAELDKVLGPLPEDLRARMIQHPKRGVELLHQAGVTDTLWLDAVAGHHERLNGSGYPSSRSADLISVGARILAVADIYSAMEKPRPYRNKAHFPQNALKEIYLKKDAEIDGEMAHILISRIGLLPPGTIVKLSCGEVAVIKSPTVRAEGATVYSIYGKSGMVLADPIRRDTTQTGYAIASLVPYAEIRAAAVTIKRVWTK